jgi:hypothetical protein
MDSSNFCVHAMETKMSSKICVHAMKTPTICHNFWIYHKNKISMHAAVHVHVDVVYAISMNYLRYFCELFLLFAQKTEPQFMA